MQCCCELSSGENPLNEAQEKLALVLQFWLRVTYPRETKTGLLAQLGYLIASLNYILIPFFVCVKQICLRSCVRSTECFFFLCPWSHRCLKGTDSSNCMLESQRVYLSLPKELLQESQPNKISMQLPILMQPFFSLRLFNKLTEKPLLQFSFRIAIYWSSPGFTMNKLPIPEKQVPSLPQFILCAQLTQLAKSFGSFSTSILQHLFSSMCCHFLVCC